MSRLMGRFASARERGAVAVMVAILTPVLLIMAAFAVDAANAYAQGRQLSVAADAAALAAAAKVGERLPPGTPCTAAFAASKVPLATEVANDYNSVNNRYNGPEDSEPVDSVTVTCVDTDGDGRADTIDVAVSNSREVPTAIAQVIGVDSLQPNATATARWSRRVSVGGLRPWAVCDETSEAAQQAFADGDTETTFVTGLDNKVGICSNGPTAGNWGSMNFEGGSPDASSLADWTRDGYPGPVIIPSQIPADPGVTNSGNPKPGNDGLKAAFQSLVGQVVAFPSVRECTDDCLGNNAEFDTVGILTARVCGIQYANSTYNEDPATGGVVDCWKDPSTFGSTPGRGVVTNSAEMTKNGESLTASDAAFTEEDEGAVVTVAGAGSGGKDLTATVEQFISPTEVRLGDKAQNDVAGATVTFVDTDVLPQRPNGSYVDHIQFQYQDYSVSSYAGSAAQTCPLDPADPNYNPLCVGTVELYR
jgi:hypothetical protein